LTQNAGLILARSFFDPFLTISVYRHSRPLRKQRLFFAIFSSVLAVFAYLETNGYSRIAV
jgi:hypothetical protein